MSHKHVTHQHDTPSGVGYAFAAFGLWGVMPLYFQLMRAVPSSEILAHRIVYSTVFLLALLALWGRLDHVRASLMDSHRRKMLAMSSALIGLNWFVYIQGVNSGHIIETALGYFINPFFSVFLGSVIFRERLRPLQWLAIAIATTGIMYLVFKSGTVPWFALTLAATFGLYGAIRKTTPVDGTLGLAVESILLLPLAVGYLIFLTLSGHLELAEHGTKTMAYVFGSGVVLTLPMIFFGQAARGIRLSTMGFLQFIAPTLQYFTAVYITGEKEDPNRIVCFLFVWSALALYTADTLYFLHGRRRVRAVESPVVASS